MSALYIFKGIALRYRCNVQNCICGIDIAYSEIKTGKSGDSFFNDYLEILILFLGGIKTVSFVSLKFELSSMMPT